LTNPSNILLAHQLAHQLGYDILEIKLEDYIVDNLLDEDNAHYFLYYFFDHHCRIGEPFEKYEETRDIHANQNTHMEARRMFLNLIRTNSTISQLFEWFRLHYNPIKYKSNDMEIEAYAGCEEDAHLTQKEVTLKSFSSSMSLFVEYIYLLTKDQYKWLWVNVPIEKEFTLTEGAVQESYSDSPDMRSRSNSLETNKENEITTPGAVSAIYNLVVNSATIQEKDKNTFIQVQSSKPETLRCTIVKNVDTIGSSDILLEIKIHETATIKFRVSKADTNYILACRYSLCPASLYNVKLQYNVDMVYSQEQVEALSSDMDQINSIENEKERNEKISKMPKIKIENAVMVEREPLSYAKHSFIPYESASPIHDMGTCRGAYTDCFGSNCEEDYVNIQSREKTSGKFLICTIDVKFDFVQK
jgi:hypothetical protein